MVTKFSSQFLATKFGFVADWLLEIIAKYTFNIVCSQAICVYKCCEKSTIYRGRAWTVWVLLQHSGPIVYGTAAERVWFSQDYCLLTPSVVWPGTPQSSADIRKPKWWDGDDADRPISCSTNLYCKLTFTLGIIDCPLGDYGEIFNTFSSCIQWFMVEVSCEIAFMWMSMHITMITQHWLRQWLCAIWHESIAWSHVDQGPCRHIALLSHDDLHWYRNILLG